MKDLRARTVLLTGASSGLGPHIATRLRAEGASLVLSSRSRDRLERVASQIGGARVIVADLNRRDEVESLAEQAGPVDVLIANAGLPASGQLVTFSADEIDRAINVNLRAPIVLARLLLPGMLARRSGHLVFIASMQSKVPAALISVYNATKFGLRGFGLALGKELRASGVGVSVINPTFVSEVGMWAETGVTTHRLAGHASPAAVAKAVIEGINENRAEIDVAPLGARLAVAAPHLVGSIASLLGATGIPEAAVTRQLTKR